MRRTNIIPSKNNAEPVQFSHIYVEEAARSYPDTDYILSRFADARQISLPHYKDVFNRKQQSFRAQKESVKLILAVQQGNFIYKGDSRIQSFQESGVYYNALIRNCLYNCEYCFLQGIHKTANIVIFVNNDDFMEAAYQKARQSDGMYLSISYLSDLLAFEEMIPFNRRWFQFAHENPNIVIESRTKSDNYPAIRNIKPSTNIILVWSLTPTALARKHEIGCASFQNRLFQVATAIQDAWRVRIAFDPIIALEDWEMEYQHCIDTVFARIDPTKLEAVSIGLFRMYPGFLKYMKNDRPESTLLHYNFTETQKSLRYEDAIATHIRSKIAGMVREYLPDSKIFFARD